MMKWGRTKAVSSSSSWFSKLSGYSELKPAKEKKQDDKASKNMSAKCSLSSTKRRSGIHDISKSFQRVLIEKEKAATRSTDMGSNEKFEETMSCVRKKVRDLQRETCGFLEVEAMDRDKGTVIMTPRIYVNRDKQRRDQRLLEQQPKRTEQDAKIKPKKPARRIGREDSVVSGHQWQKLKETKLREVKLKADQQRKSLYIKRELNSKVRVFSPRASEKCRVKAIEDLKKAKMRATEEDGGKESESFAVVKCSRDPQKDFRDSMIEMIMENGMNKPEELKELLVCYLRLNTNEYHEMIIEVFKQVHNDLNFH